MDSLHLDLSASHDFLHAAECSLLELRVVAAKCFENDAEDLFTALSNVMAGC